MSLYLTSIVHYQQMANSFKINLALLLLGQIQLKRYLAKTNEGGQDYSLTAHKNYNSSVNEEKEGEKTFVYGFYQI